VLVKFCFEESIVNISLKNYHKQISKKCYFHIFKGRLPVDEIK
jgi:hypothetical protein